MSVSNRRTGILLAGRMAAVLGLPAWLLLSGCGDEPIITAPSSQPAPTTAAPTPAADSSAAAPAETPEARTPIVGATTTEIRNTQTELDTGKAQVADMKITARDPITITGNAYVSMVGQLTISQITHAMNIYEATNGRYPADLDEFMTEIIQANNIALPLLPVYQKYSYDEDEHKLVVLEYPHIKEQELNKHRRQP